MRILAALFGGGDIVQPRPGAETNVATHRDLYETLWLYYLNNGLYQDLRLAGFRLDNRRLKGLYNPAQRAVEFFVDTVWPGALPDALPIQAENQKILDPIQDIWRWSNWGIKKQTMVRWAGVTGDAYLRVARPIQRDPTKEAPERVYIQLIRPAYVTDQEVDERGYLVYCRLDIPQDGYHQVEVWEPERLRVWYPKESGEREIAQLGTPEHDIDTRADWGIDFVPIVHAQWLDLGASRGVGAYTLQIDKIDELNHVATRLHQILYRHNDVTWALESNMMGESGRPLPPPRIRLGDSGPDGEELDVVEVGGERMVRLPGMAKLVPLIPQLQYGPHLDAVAAMVEELERDLPQLAYYKLKDLPEMSGVALRLLLAPAIAKAKEVRGNLEEALARAHMMALTIGQEIGAWSAIGTYEKGDFDHTFVERPALPYSRAEVAELAALEVGAGIPLRTSLRRSGWTEEQLDQMEEDAAAESTAQQANLAGALMQAQAQMGGGANSNGLENPGGEEESLL